MNLRTLFFEPSNMVFFEIKNLFNFYPNKILLQNKFSRR